MDTLKLYLYNALSVAVTFTNIENGLKLTLLLLSIVYTAQKIIRNMD